MAESSRYDNPGDDSGMGPDIASPPGVPGWVKVFGIILLTVVLLLVIVMIAGGGAGSHGPGRH